MQIVPHCDHMKLMLDPPANTSPCALPKALPKKSEHAFLGDNGFCTRVQWDKLDPCTSTKGS